MLKKICMTIMLSGSMLYSISDHKKIMKKSTEFSYIVKSRPAGDLGVFAARDIAQGTQLFHDPFEVRILKTKDIPAEFLNYCIPVNDEESACPQRFDRMEIGWYMNLSSTDANVEKRIDRTYDNIIDLLKANSFYATKDIKAGEEILINVEPVKEHFPTK